MCGIWAIFGSMGDIASLCNCMHKISHRGPDAFRIESIHYFPNSCLAFHRLAIVDDLCGMQPMRSFQHPYVYLIYNGEIYNFKELEKEFDIKQDTACDGEIIIHLYAKYGIEFAAKHLDGVFFFCLMDTANRKVYLGRDTFGVKPGFRITSDDGFLAVCSEAKGLMGLSGNSSKTSKVEHFPPGHVETYSLDKEGRAVLTEWSRFHKVAEEPAYPTFPVTIGNDAKQNIRQFFTMAVRKRLMADRRVGCLLSGGLDSSLVTALVVKLTKQLGIDYKIQTFSVGMEGSTDLKAAKKKIQRGSAVCTHRLDFIGGWPCLTWLSLFLKMHSASCYYYKTTKHYFAPFYSMEDIRTYFAPLIQIETKVADFLGTEHHELVFTPEQGTEVLENTIYHLEGYDIVTVRSSVALYLLSQYIKEKTDTTVVLSGEGSDEVTQGYIYFHKAPSCEEASEDSIRLCNDLYMFDVLRADRTTSAWGLEMRVPFLDHRFSHYYMSLPGEDKLPKHGIEKHLLRSAFSGEGLLPDEILWRPKETFSDGLCPVSKSWYEVLQDHVDVQINDDELEDSAKIFTHNTPRTKEALFYRRIFEKFYQGHGKWMPYFWMPRWSETSDPSARTLKHYKQ